MAWWEWPLEAAGVLLALVLVYGVALMVRRRFLSRNGGTFELSHRVRGGRPGRGWLLGLGRYSGSSLEWFRIFSLSPRPKRTWVRAELTYVSSRSPAGMEQMSLYPDHVVVVCRSGSRDVELAMSPDSLIGFQAWLESRNPGTDWTTGR
ncbi:DUF2550 domain-containing protein [Nocardioides sp. DS6]|uniref:DUF2550 domain-containing protein n=1 Tax=Nocardioides eburneus TaxID=3231482 RepID=A0ABV3T1A4_9ACTN